MRDDEIRRILVESNPWWRSPVVGGDPTRWASSHRVLRGRNDYDRGYRSRVLRDIEEAPISDSLVVLAGPRRVGKSVVLLDTILALCARPDIDSRQLVHVPCDGFKARDLRRVLTLGRELTRSIDAGTGPVRRVWMFDEVTSVEGWTSVLKGARDGTMFGDDTVVATGSRWSGESDIATDLLTGRAGTTDLRRLRHVAPMSFREYIGASGRGLAAIPSVGADQLQSEDARRALESVAFDVDAYDLAWQDYLTCGGFPRAVAEHVRSGSVSIAFQRDLRSWLQTDVDPDAATESVPRLLHEIALRSSSPLNVAATAEKLNYPSRRVLDARIQRLISSFAAVKCHKHDSQGAVAVGSQSKLYLADPLLAWLPQALHAGLAAPDMTKLTEMTLGISLAHAIDSAEEGRWMSGDTIGYVRTASDNEVDFGPVAVPTGGGRESTCPIESKWVDQGWRSESLTMRGRFGVGICATKSILDLSDEIWAVPAPLLALLLR